MASAELPPRIGRYEPLLPIGTGGMATVYLARAPIADGVSREVALKLVHPHLRASEAAARELVEEAKLAARIVHPNVVAVREVGEDALGIYLVMDYVEGATLARLVRAAAARERELPLPILLRILVDALAGLHAAHELRSEDGTPLGLVHRDFSPQNVLVGLDGVTRLTDFGIARAATRANVTSTGLVKGKLGYLSPEQAQGLPLDRRSDVWAAGVVAWELFAGRRLHAPDAEPVATMLKIAGETPPRLSSLRPELPPLLDQAIATALSLEPGRRWPSAAELGAALAGLGAAEAEEVGDFVRDLCGDELRARQDAHRRPTIPAAAPRRPRRWPIALTAAGALAILAAVLLSSTTNERPPPPAPVADEPAQAADPPPLAIVAEQDAAIAEPPPAPRRTAQPRARTAPRAPSLGPNPYR
jgi:eukaryotic-like serine/threonine-protein kinase